MNFPKIRELTFHEYGFCLTISLQNLKLAARKFIKIKGRISCFSLSQKRALLKSVLFNFHFSC